jgi:hypothetical protein
VDKKKSKKSESSRKKLSEALVSLSEELVLQFPFTAQVDAATISTLTDILCLTRVIADQYQGIGGAAGMRALLAQAVSSSSTPRCATVFHEGDLGTLSIT